MFLRMLVLYISSGLCIAFSIASGIILFYYEIYFHKYIDCIAFKKTNAKTDVIEKYWKQEKRSNWLHIFVVVMAAICSLLCYLKCLDQRAAVWVIIPLALSIYRVLYRCSFRIFTNILIALAAIFLYISSLMLYDRGANVLNIGINGADIVKTMGHAIYAIPGAISGFSILLFLFKEVYKTIKQHASDNSNAAADGHKARRAILKRCLPVFWVFVIVISLLAFAEIAWEIIDPQYTIRVQENDKTEQDEIPKNDSMFVGDAAKLGFTLNLDAQVAHELNLTETVAAEPRKLNTHFGNALDTQNTIESSQIDDSNIAPVAVSQEDNANKTTLSLMAHLSIVSILLCTGGVFFFFCDAMTKSALIRAELNYIGYGTSLLFVELDKKQKPRGQKGSLKRTETLQKNILQVFFHIMYSPKQFITSQSFVDKAKTVLQETMGYQVKHISEDCCLSLEALSCQDALRTFIINYPANAEKKLDENQIADASKSLLDILESAKSAEATNNQKMEPFALFVSLKEKYFEHFKPKLETFIWNDGLTSSSAVHLAFHKIIEQRFGSIQKNNKRGECGVYCWCLKNTCRLQREKKNDLICNLWRELLIFVNNITQYASEICVSEAPNLIAESAYVKYFKAIADDECFRFISEEKLTVDGAAEIVETLSQLKETQSFDIIARMWEKVAVDDARKAAAMEAYEKERERIKAVLIAHNWEEQESLQGIELDEISAERIRKDKDRIAREVKPFFLLLFYLTLA